MFKMFKKKRSWKQEQADIDRLTELMFKRNMEMTKMYWDEYNELIDKYSLNGNQGN